MKHSIYKVIIISTTLLITAPAFSAAYMKFDGVNGESTQPAPARTVKAPDGNNQALLLPAVQQVREAAATTPQTPGSQSPAKVQQPGSAPAANTLTPEQAEALRKAIKEANKPCGLNSNKPC